MLNSAKAMGAFPVFHRGMGWVKLDTVCGYAPMSTEQRGKTASPHLLAMLLPLQAGLCQLSLLPACAASTRVTHALPELPKPFQQPVLPNPYSSISRVLAKVFCD